MGATFSCCSSSKADDVVVVRARPHVSVEVVNLDGHSNGLEANSPQAVVLEDGELDIAGLTTPQPNLAARRASSKKKQLPFASPSIESLSAACVRPVGVPADKPLPQSTWSHQLEKLEEARQLVDELRACRAKLSESEIIACSVQPQGPSHPVEIGFELYFESTWDAVIRMSVTKCDLGLRTFLGLLREPDLIEFPKIPGLPFIEGVEHVKEFAPNDVVFRVCVSPWGPVPGLADINNVYCFDALDEGDGCVMLYAQSPPEKATHHRGWPLPPMGKHRKRNVIGGLAIVATPSAGFRGPVVPPQQISSSTKAAPSTPKRDTAAMVKLPTCRSPGCPFPARHATGGYCCEKCRTHRCKHGAHCTAWLPTYGACDVEACCRVKLPIPKWLLPPPLIRWLVPKLIAKIFWPKLVQCSANFDTSEFGERFRADKTGFYKACSERLPLAMGELEAARHASAAPVTAAHQPPAQSTLNGVVDGDEDEDGGVLLSARSASADFDDLSPDCRGATRSAERLATL